MQVMCKRCRKSVGKDEIHFMDSNTFYCSRCYADLKGESKPASRDFDITPSSKEQFTCGKCGFTTSVDTRKARKMCSYCGSEDLSPKKNTAAEMLKEAENDPLDFFSKEDKV